MMPALSRNTQKLLICGAAPWAYRGKETHQQSIAVGTLNSNHRLINRIVRLPLWFLCNNPPSPTHTPSLTLVYSSSFTSWSSAIRLLGSSTSHNRPVTADWFLHRTAPWSLVLRCFVFFFPSPKITLLWLHVARADNFLSSFNSGKVRNPPAPLLTVFLQMQSRTHIHIMRNLSWSPGTEAQGSRKLD